MIDPYVILAPVLLLAVVALLRFVGCAGLIGIDKVSYTPAATPPAPVFSVHVDPPSAISLNAWDTHQFSAKVYQDSQLAPDQTVAWFATPGPNPQQNGLYTAPAPSSVPGYIPGSDIKVTVTAASGTYGVKDQATVTLNPVTVKVNPPTDVCVGASGTQSFTATVTNDSNDAQKKGVTWEGVGIDAQSGLYKAPALVASAQKVAITARSKADPNVTDKATVYLYPFPPCRPAGWVLDQNPTNPLLANPLANLVGLFIMNEGLPATSDTNLVDSQSADFKGTSPPTWANDPSIKFNGGGPQNSFLDAKLDPAFNSLPTGQMTIVAKVNGNTGAPAGICEKNDELNQGSGFLFGWTNNGALSLMVGRANTNMRVTTGLGAVPNGNWVQVALTWDGNVGTAAAARFYVQGVEITTRTLAQDGLGLIGSAGKNFRIGTAGFAPSYAAEAMVGSLDGNIAYLAIYKGKILSPAEITQLDKQLPIKPGP